MLRETLLVADVIDGEVDEVEALVVDNFLIHADSLKEVRILAAVVTIQLSRPLTHQLGQVEQVADGCLVALNGIDRVEVQACLQGALPSVKHLNVLVGHHVKFLSQNQLRCFARHHRFFQGGSSEDSVEFEAGVLVDVVILVEFDGDV